MTCVCRAAATSEGAQGSTRLHLQPLRYAEIYLFKAREIRRLCVGTTGRTKEPGFRHAVCEARGPAAHCLTASRRSLTYQRSKFDKSIPSRPSCTSHGAYVAHESLSTATNHTPGLAVQPCPSSTRCLHGWRLYNLLVPEPGSPFVPGLSRYPLHATMLQPRHQS